MAIRTVTPIRFQTLPTIMNLAVSAPPSRLNRNGEPSNAQAAFIASVIRMRTTSAATAGAIRHTSIHDRKTVKPYCMPSKASPSRWKRAEHPAIRQGKDRAAATERSRASPRGKTPSSFASAQSRPMITSLPARVAGDSRFPESLVPDLASQMSFYSGDRPQEIFCDILERDSWARMRETEDQFAPEQQGSESENDRIVQEMFALYTNFDATIST